MVSLEDIKNVVVIGGGLMGSGIAQVALLTGYEKVTIIDLNSEILEKSRIDIQNRIEALESEKFKEIYINAVNAIEIADTIDFESKKGDFASVGILANGDDTKSIMEHLSIETDISKGVSDADFIIEAVPEVLSIKQEVFKKLGQFSPPHAILASNTSAMSITKIAQFCDRKEKVIGLHFHTFYPLLGMLIEITPGEDTSEESMDIGVEFSQRLPCLIGERFTVKLEKESPGLIANRLSLIFTIYFSWVRSQAQMEGISNEQLDAAGMSFELLDRIGIDTVYNIDKYLEEFVSPEFAPGALITDLVKKGRLGRKVGKGYYDWDENGPIRNLPPPKPETMMFLAQHFDEELYTAFQLNEACRLLEEGVVNSYELIEKVLMKGTFSEGPFKLGKEKYKEWSNKLHNVVEKTGKTYLKPCEMMESGKFLSYK